MPREIVHIKGLGPYQVVDATDLDECSDFKQHRADTTEDGEPLHREDGAERRVGSTVSHALALKIAVPELSVANAVGMTAEFTHERGRKLNTHNFTTDCGLVRLASEEEHGDLFGIDPAQVRSVRRRLEKAADSLGIELDDHHLVPTESPAGVLLVKSTDRTVIPLPGSGQVYRSDKTRARASNREFAAFARKRGLDVTGPQLNEIADRHEAAALGLLAPGLPMHEISLNGHRRVRSLGKVQPPA